MREKRPAPTLKITESAIGKIKSAARTWVSAGVPSTSLVSVVVCTKEQCVNYQL